MKFTIKKLNITTGSVHVAVVHEKDAELHGLHPTDRIMIHQGKRSLPAIVDCTTTVVKPGTIGLFTELASQLTSAKVAIQPAPKPQSLAAIKKKLDGERLNQGEIFTIIEDITKGYLLPVEMSAYVFANYMHNMTAKEILYQTQAMAKTGQILKLRKKVVADLHCIGGIAGNRTTLIVVPIVLAAGLTMPKTSTRAITSPSGTIDTFEVLTPVTFPLKKMHSIVKKVGGCIAWGGKELKLAPSDDLIINIEHPLSIDAESQMLSSIMAKKVAVSITHMVLDIPYGREAKVKTRFQAKRLGKKFQKLGRALGIHVHIVPTHAQGPIGHGIGPALEARECLDILMNNGGSQELREKSLYLAGQILEQTGIKNGHARATELLQSGAAYKKFVQLIRAQGGKVPKRDEIQLGAYMHTITAKKSGTISNHSIIQIAKALGAPKNRGAGVYIHKIKGVPRITLYAENASRLQDAKKLCRSIAVVR